MISRLEVKHFKGFAHFTVDMEPTTVLIGPNNAGKSTLFSALRSAAAMFRYAQRRKPILRDDIEPETALLAYTYQGDPFEIGTENLRHDFRPGTASFKLDFSSPILRLMAVWPQKDDPYFFIIDPSTGWQPSTPKQFQALGDLLGVIPALRPVEPVEALLEPNYVERNVAGPLASRHFRNQLLLLSRGSDVFGGDWGAFMELCGSWGADAALEAPTVRQAEKGSELDVFYNEGRGPRELIWAGDGFQVWFQLLLHVLRLRRHGSVILDEPEVYLHPDLQRRLMHLLETLPGQIILATHSPEIAAEVPDDSIVLVDRSRPRGLRPAESRALYSEDLGLGTRLNFALAKTLRARLSLFVEERT